MMELLQCCIFLNSHKNYIDNFLKKFGFSGY